MVGLAALGITLWDRPAMTCLLASPWPSIAADPADRPCVVVVVGTPGTPEYEIQFRKWAAPAGRPPPRRRRPSSIAIGLADEAGTSDRDRLKAVLAGKATGRSRSGSS